MAGHLQENRDSASTPAPRVLRLLACAAALLLAAPAWADGAAPSDTGLYSEAFKALFLLFVLAVLMESALSIIFNWRPFLDSFDSRGVKTLVAVGAAYGLVALFDLDIVSRLVKVYGAGLDGMGRIDGNSLPGRVLTALILAGGSSGVNNLLVALGFRSLRTADQIVPKPPPTKAWVSVRLLRKEAVGRVSVYIGPPASQPLAGTISGTSRGNRWLWYFIRDRGRFPTAGGFVVEPNADCVIRLSGVMRDGTAIASAAWGPHQFAPGALVDIDMTL